MSRTRDTVSTRRRGRRAIRGVVLLAGVLGSLSALVAGGVPAGAATNHSLDFYYNLDGNSTWHASGVAGTGTSYSAPAMARFSDSAGTGTEVTVEGPSHQLEFYYNLDGNSTWHASTIAGIGAAYSAPAMARFSDSAGTGTEVVVEGPSHQLEFYYNLDGNSTWHASGVAGTDTSYSAPAMARFSDSAGTGTEVTVEGPAHQLKFYYNLDGNSTWHASTIAGIGAAYSAPAIARFSNATETGTEVVVEGPSHQLEFYYNLDGNSTWHASGVAGTHTSYSAPAIARFSDSAGTGTEVTAEGPAHQLKFYYNLDGNSTWHASTIAGIGTTYSEPAIARFSDSTGTGTEVTAEG